MQKDGTSPNIFIKNASHVLSQDPTGQQELSDCDILIEGSILKAGTAKQLTEDEQVRNVYLGKNFELR